MGMHLTSAPDLGGKKYSKHAPSFFGETSVYVTGGVLLQWSNGEHQHEDITLWHKIEMRDAPHIVE